MSNEIKHISGAAGGYLVGNSHDNGGIQAINKAIGKPLEMEGGEVVITKPAVEDNELREFEGKMLTNRQILSKINESGGGVSFAELGAELPTKIEFCGTEYKYGGETLTDYEIAHRISKCGCSHEENSYADGGETDFLIAPNGKPSNLNPTQWHLVRTAVFKEWFGDWENDAVNSSKIIDKNGEPLVVYHGRSKYFTEFSNKYAGKHTSDNGKLGFFFTDDYNLAKMFTKNKWSNKKSTERKGANILEVFLKATNPKVIDGRQFTMLGNAEKYKLEQVENGYDSIIINPMNEEDLDSWKRIFGEQGIEEFQSYQFAVFYPNQIKIADGTNITFNNNSNDIRYKKGGNIEKDLKDNAVNVAVNATETLPLMEKGGETSESEFLQSNTGKNLKKDAAFLVGLQDAKQNNKPSGGWDINLFKSSFYNKVKNMQSTYVTEIMNYLTSLEESLKVKPIFTQNHKIWEKYEKPLLSDDAIERLSNSYAKLQKDGPNENLKSIQSINNQINSNRKPKYNVNDFVTYKTDDIETETWVGVVKEVKDFDTEYAYRLDAYTTNVDSPMFDSEKTNETYEASLKPSTSVAFNKAMVAYENYIANKQPNYLANILKKIDTIVKDISLRMKGIPSGYNLDEFRAEILYIFGKLSEKDKKGVSDYLIELEKNNNLKPIFDINNEIYFGFYNKIIGNIELNKTYQISDYKNPYEVNRAIEALLDSKENNFTPNEIEFISNYSGYGGLEKQGTFSFEELSGLLYEYFTPDAVVKKMWALAYKYGFGTFSNPHIMEPSVGTGNFFKYAPTDAELFGNEINNYSKRVCEILYPKAMITLQPFEKNFISKNNSIKNKLNDIHKYHLVIGNPPYGALKGKGKYLQMGESDYTKASNFTEYFITRGLDLLHPGGLLIFVVGAEQYNGGTLFLDSGISVVKKNIFDKAQLVDAYRLPTKIFERTGVASEILVFKKK